MDLYKILGFVPRHISLYKRALLHSSVNASTTKTNVYNNERLEFLGDAVLNSIVSDILYHRFEAKREGFLTNSRSNLVKRSMLNGLAKKIGLDKLMVVSLHNSVSHQSYLCGNAFEAFIGAIYLDRGYDVCKRFIERRVIRHLINLDKEACREQNFKSRLLEWSQRNRTTVLFDLVAERVDKEGPVFETHVKIEGLFGGEGMAFTKKESQQIAARKALSRINCDADFNNKVLALRDVRLAANE